MVKVNLQQINDRCQYNPFARWLGMEVTEHTHDTLRFAVKFREEMIGSPDTGYLHGGVSAAIIDNACCYVLALQAGKFVPTIDMRIDYHRGSKPEYGIQGYAKILKYGKTVSSAEAFIESDDGTLLTSGRCTFYTGFDPSKSQQK